MLRHSLLATVVGAAALAQAPDNLIGLTRTTPIVNQRDHNNCAQLPFCLPPGFPPALAQPYAGGTGYDPIRDGVWISNGALIALVDATACNYLCPPQPAPLVSPNAVVTGLAMVESLNEVWMLDSFGNLYRLTYGCPLAVIGVCNTGLALTATNATGGLAVDEKNQLVFYSYSDWTAFTTTVHVAAMANPCLILQTVTVPGCIGSLLRGCTGLGVDACREILYLTDGVTTMAWAYMVLPGPVVVFGPQNCCSLAPPVAGDVFVGLCVRTGAPTPFGPPCANGTCPVCPMVHTTRGRPNLGNAQFALRLDQAPFNSLTWCIIGGGPCGPPGVVVPPLCGPIFTGPVLGTIGSVPTPPGVGCGATAIYPLPLPMIPSLCGAILSSQCVAFCFAGGAIGTSLSNCLSWQLQSN